ncbi:ribbon-helix-helix protein, CopG family [Calidifontibacter sp. DB0510]|uniref:Ribbon-helix-helix protein, CopG family n=1 Tax=Metallococcus carri TaxID=1656884 RepID=A0A967EA11_9MICO|nr:CopG family transcriptional regulator [Metallococcus carri]NHN56972.1 ribbon-helix-helix protein, CopG family [Metallococcus carri]NOP37717.1 ribbon-helix-helix protein, CopG family [Calidifontibacter sp. DB2511S]
MKTAISLPDDAAERFDDVARRHNMTRSEFYRQAAERYADTLSGGDLTAQIDEAIDAVGQPGEESAELRSAANARLVEASDEW